MTKSFYAALATFALLTPLSVFLLPQSAQASQAPEKEFSGKEVSGKLTVKFGRSKGRGHGRQVRSTSLLGRHALGYESRPYQNGRRARVNSMPMEATQFNILELPTEILFHVASFLDPHALFTMMHVCQRWRSSLVGYDFGVKASVRFTGKREGSSLFVRDEMGGAQFISGPQGVQQKVKEVTLLGKYPSQRAPLKQRARADENLARALHPHLEVLRWDRASRSMPIQVLEAYLPQVKALTTLCLTGGNLKTNEALRILTLPALKHLRHIDLSNNCLDGDFVEQISSLTCAQTLEALNLSQNSLSKALRGQRAVSLAPQVDEDDEGESLFTVVERQLFQGHASPLLPRLASLDVSHNALTPESSTIFARALGVCPGLTHLNVSHNDLGEEGVRVFLSMAQSGALRRLDARHARMPDLACLSHEACLSLEELRLDGNALQVRVIGLSTLAFASTLKVLTLSKTQMTAPNLEALVAAGAFPQVETLNLSSNHLDGRANLLEDASCLPNLRSLSLSKTGTSWETITTLIRLRPLAFFDVRHNGPVPKARAFWWERMNPDLVMNPDVSLPSRQCLNAGALCVQAKAGNSFALLEDNEA
ncbi:MAG: F-box-like domain-containing protein [Proteobacteria bacterium]|nr:F-box-like domain-containing protein [Pseudomonadota bacterium]